MFMFANVLIANVGKIHNSQLIDACNYKASYGYTKIIPESKRMLMQEFPSHKANSDYEINFMNIAIATYLDWCVVHVHCSMLHAFS